MVPLDGARQTRILNPKLAEANSSSHPTAAAESYMLFLLAWNSFLCSNLEKTTKERLLNRLKEKSHV